MQCRKLKLLMNVAWQRPINSTRLAVRSSWNVSSARYRNQQVTLRGSMVCGCWIMTQVVVESGKVKNDLNSRTHRENLFSSCISNRSDINLRKHDFENLIYLSSLSLTERRSDAPVWRQICSLQVRLVACILQMQIVTTPATTVVVSWHSLELLNLLTFSTLHHHDLCRDALFAALADIAQSSVMVHVLIGENLHAHTHKHFLFYYWWTLLLFTSACC